MNTVLNVLARTIDGVEPSSVRDDTVLKTISGWDSMSAVTFLIALEDDFSIDLSDLDLSQVATFGQLCAVLLSRGIAAAALPTLEQHQNA